MVAVVSQAPVLCALIPLESFEHILQQHQRKASPSLTALVLNQPLGRQLELIRLALPAARRVGVLWGPQSLPQAGALRDAARSRGLELREANVTSDTQLASGLRLLLASTDVLLAIAEASLYNARTVESILYSAMREHVPVVSFSPSYSRAGAMLALYAARGQAVSATEFLLHMKRAGLPPDAEAFGHLVAALVRRSTRVSLCSAAAWSPRARSSSALVSSTTGSSA